MRSQPWWQHVADLQGEGADDLAVAIDAVAIQWRVRWTCERGRLVVDAGPSSDRPLVDAACPGEDVAYATSTGSVRLRVAATGPWRLAVEQQLDLPLEEPPLPAMTAPGAAPVLAGTFHDMDQVGRGAVTVYRLADGSHALRLEDFFVTPNVDLEVRLSAAPDPRTTEDYTAHPSALVSVLDVTAGSMNFAIPAGVDPSAWRSVVIWCPPLHVAYAGAVLEPVASR